MSDKKHIPALDGIRGAAVLLVMAHNINAIHDPTTLPTKLYDIIMGWGWVGVQIFFVLSGFLITGILLDSRHAKRYFRTFIMRRALRIFPLYYAMLLAIFVLVPLLTGHTLKGSEHQIWLWTYLSNWAAPFGREVAGFTHFWSLGIEEQFYLLWPLVVMVLSPRGLLRLCVGLGVVALAARVGLALIDFNAEGPYMFTICRVDALAAGAAGAVLIRRPAVVERYRALRDSSRTKTLVATVALLLVTVLVTRGAPRKGVLTQTFGYSVFALVCLAMVFDAALDAPGDWLHRAWRAGWLRRVGKYSYAMYMFHLPLHLFGGEPLLTKLRGGATVTVPMAFAYFLVMSLLTFLAAMASYHLLEKHFLRLKRHFETQPRPS